MKRILKRTGLLTVLLSLALFIFSCGSSTQVHVSNRGRGHQGVNYDVRYDNSPKNHRNMKKHHKKTPPPKPHKHHKRHR